VKTVARRFTLAFISAVIVLAWATVASAQWSAAGATGAVDESDLSMYVFGSNGAVALRSSVRGTLNVRFPVEIRTPVQTRDSDCPEIQAVLRDTGPGARVIVRLMRLGIGGEATIGELISIGEIDSDTRPPVGDPNRFRSFRACLVSPSPDGFEGGIDFTYYVEAQLIKTTATGNPGLMAVRFCSSQDFCDP
jgi:hypothetical protein